MRPLKSKAPQMERSCIISRDDNNNSIYLRNTVYKIILLGLLLLLAFLAIQPVQAQSPTPTPAATATNGDKNVFSFSDLGMGEQILNGPYSSTSVPFSIPANWELIAGGNVQLNFTYTQSMVGNGAVPINSNQIHGVLIVMLNDQTLENVFLDRIGDYSVTVPIDNQKALTSPTKDGRNVLRILLDASASCTYGDVQSTLLLKSTSTIRLEHQAITPSVDLALFPRPLYQPNSVFPTRTILLVPDEPSAAELQATLAVSSGLGMLSQGKLQLVLEPYASLSEEDRKSSFLIFVGKAVNFPILANVSLPVAVAKDGLTLTGDDGSTGVIQMAVSPWDNTKTILVVGGNSDEAVLKAGQALSTGKVFTSGRPDLSLVSSISNQRSIAVIEEQTLADLGYSTQTLETIGDNYLDILFTITPEQADSTNASIDLVLSHSNLLNEIGTTYSIFLNDQIISSDFFDESAEQISQKNIRILPHILRAGENRLEIFSNLLPYNTCHATDFSASWLTVSDATTIHIPLPAADEATIQFSETLSDYPTLLLDHPMFSDLAMVVPQKDPAAWQAAAQVAFYLGSAGNPIFTDLAVYYGDSLLEEVRTNHSLIFVGLASTLPVLAEINSGLPAPYDLTTNQANQTVMLVNYSLPEGVNVGYVQFMVSPWNAEKVILSVSGNTSAGIPMAARALSTLTQVSKLDGNFALINGEQILTTNTLLGVGKGGLVEQVPGSVPMTPTPQVTSTNPTDQSAVEIAGRPGWLLPLMIGSFITFVLFLLAFVVRSVFLRAETKKVKQKFDQSRHKPGSD